LLYDSDTAKASLLFYNMEGLIMAYVISDSCVKCGTCEPECPVGAISQGDSQFEIDGASCVECGTCAGVCPTGAISQE
jgi:ferredoxin